MSLIKLLNEMNPDADRVYKNDIRQIKEFEEWMKRNGFYLEEIYKKNKFIGKGWYANVYRFKNYVLKITLDYRIFKDAESLVNKKLKNVSNILFASEIPPNINESEWFLIIQKYEEGELLKEFFNKNFNFKESSFFIKMYFLKYCEIAYELISFENYLKRIQFVNINTILTEIGTEKIDLINKIAQALFTGVNELKSNNAFPHDIHFSNVIINKKMEIKIFDW